MNIKSIALINSLLESYEILYPLFLIIVCYKQQISTFLDLVRVNYLRIKSKKGLNKLIRIFD